MGVLHNPHKYLDSIYLNKVEVDALEKITIDTGNLANGLYITDIVTTRGKTTKRLLISK